MGSCKKDAKLSVVPVTSSTPVLQVKSSYTTIDSAEILTWMRSNLNTETQKYLQLNNAQFKFVDNHPVVKIPVTSDAAFFFTKDSTGLKAYVYKWSTKNGNLEHYTGNIISYSYQDYNMKVLVYKDGKVTTTGFLPLDQTFFGLTKTTYSTKTVNTVKVNLSIPQLFCAIFGGEWTGIANGPGGCDYTNSWLSSIANFFDSVVNWFGGGGGSSGGGGNESSYSGPGVVYAGSTAPYGSSSNYNGSGGGSGYQGDAVWVSTSSQYCPISDPNVQSINARGTQQYQPDPQPGDPPPSDPGSNGCTWTKYPISIVNVFNFNINTDQLKSDFPCAVALILSPLSNIPAYKSFVSQFLTPQKPTLTWWDSTLDWNNQGSYMLGNEKADPTSRIQISRIITLNTSMLQNSSQLLITAAMIHETLHAYIGYNIATAADNVRNNYNDYGTWFAALDAFYLVNPLPVNYSDHYQMLSDYFDQAVTILSSKDNNQHSSKEYVMAMLYGLNTVDQNCPTDMTARLNQVFSDKMNTYGITAQDLNNFNIANLNAPTSQQLPKSGCN